jgi:hypothetical protein
MAALFAQPDFLRLSRNAPDDALAMEGNIMLWLEWLFAVRQLREACSRERTFLWLMLSLMGFSCRPDNDGITSFVRLFRFTDRAYHRFLHFFHSDGVSLDRLTALWVGLCLRLYQPFEAGGRLVLLADGIKAPKEGRKMPGVKSLHQESGSNSKPEHIMGHSLQAVSLLVRSAAGHVAAIPLASRIHEGLVFSNRDRRTLLDKLVLLFLPLAQMMQRPTILVADAYYASWKIITPLLAKGHHLVTRAKNNAVAFYPFVPPQPDHKPRGRPRRYGEKVRLLDLAEQDRAFVAAPSPVYGERNVMLRYRMIDLVWRPVGRLVRFVIVKHPTRGMLFLIATDLSLAPLEIIALYGYRFKIEVGFRQAVHVIGTYAYHFWMMDMTPIRRGQGDQYLHRKPDAYRAGVRRKLRAYHLHVQLGCIAQGLLQHLAINHADTVWHHFQGWMRTLRHDIPPSELVVSHALHSSLPEFLQGSSIHKSLAKILHGFSRAESITTYPRIPLACAA